MAPCPGDDPNPGTGPYPPCCTANPYPYPNPQPYPYPYPTAGAANPYPYPSPYYNAHQPCTAAYYGPAYGTRRNTALGCLCAIVAAAIFLLVISAVILSLILRPRFPEFSVTSATVSSFSLSSQQLSSGFNLTITILNRNEKLAIFYDRVEAAVLYKSHIISETSLAPFYQDVGNATVLQAVMASVARYVDAEVVAGINADRAPGKGTVGFDMGFLVSARFTAGKWWRSRSSLLRVLCEDVRIGFADPTVAAGSMVGPPKGCKVKL